LNLTEIIFEFDLYVLTYYLWIYCISYKCCICK